MSRSEGLIRNIIFDFDGVILDSMSIRDEGFRLIFQDYSEDDVESLLAFHRENGGLSRYVKIRYFYEQIQKESVSEQQVAQLAERFSQVMLEKLVDPLLLIPETVQFIERWHDDSNLHIVSGSDGQELRSLCESLGISRYFCSIEGSPTPKTQLVSDLLARYEYLPSETILIGDSINDYDAARSNRIAFWGFNSSLLREKGLNYIESFSQFEAELGKGG